MRIMFSTKIELVFSLKRFLKIHQYIKFTTLGDV